jgi:UDP-N-acetylmuramoylalanine--D-glutamate ligase
MTSLPGGEIQRFGTDHYSLPGRHNLENLMAGILTGQVLGLNAQSIQSAIDRFPGLPHRLEWVGSICGIDFYNDSKATNVDAASRAIKSFDRPVILIAGGRHKGGDYDPLVRAAEGRVKQAVLIGESKRIIAHALRGHTPSCEASGLEEAVSMAYGYAETHDIVLLSPACSSFDMFTDYMHRGNTFKEAVTRLGNGR